MSTKVVLFEDEPDVAYLTKMLLVLRGDLVLVAPQATHVEQFASLVDWETVEVAVVDLMMPNVTGAEVMRWLRGNHPRIRIVLVTASVVTIDPELERLADRVLRKPFLIDELYGAVHGNSA